MRAPVKFAAVLLVGALCAACSGSPVSPDPHSSPGTSAGPVTGGFVPDPVSEPGSTPAPVPEPPPASGPPSPASPVVVAAGDIADCSAGAGITAAQMDSISGTVFALGDNDYVNGIHAYECYHATWGRHKARTRPTPGNHEYETPGASPYFAYFGASAGPAGLGYYSFTLGDWLVVSLNSNVSAASDSAQGKWLRQTLAGSQARCTMAFWHHPRFSSGKNGQNSHMQDLWRMLYDAGVELALSGHDHHYERFAPLDEYGAPDETRGLRQFIAGTGGAPLRQPASIAAYSEVRISEFGVLKLTLGREAYAWEFLGTSGPQDSGFASCH
jgi:hypothetical protein